MSNNCPSDHVCLKTSIYTYTNAYTAGKQRPTLQPDLVSSVAVSATTLQGKAREKEIVHTQTSTHSHGILRSLCFHESLAFWQLCHDTHKLSCCYIAVGKLD